MNFTSILRKNKSLKIQRLYQDIFDVIETRVNVVKRKYLVAGLKHVMKQYFLI